MLKNTLIALLLILVACTNGPFLIPLPIDPSAAEVRTDGVPVPVFDGTHWVLGTSTSEVRYPCNVQVGDEIVRAIVFGEREVTSDVGPYPFSEGSLRYLEDVSQLQFPIGVLVGASPSLPVPPDVSVSLDIVLVEGHVVTEGNTYSIVVRGNGVPGDRWAGAKLYVWR